MTQNRPSGRNVFKRILCLAFIGASLASAPLLFAEEGASESKTASAPEKKKRKPPVRKPKGQPVVEPSQFGTHVPCLEYHRLLFNKTLLEKEYPDMTWLDPTQLKLFEYKHAPASRLGLNPFNWRASQRVRDGVNNFMRWLHDRSESYPLMVYDRGAPLKANYFARAKYNRLGADELQQIDLDGKMKSVPKLDLDEIKKDLNELVDYIRSYEPKSREMAEREATIRMQVRAIKDQYEFLMLGAKRSGGGDPCPCVIDLPAMKNGRVAPEFDESLAFQKTSEITDYMKKLKNEYDLLTNGGRQTERSYHGRSIQQARALEEARAWLRELDNQALKDKSRPIPREVKAMMTKLKALFDSKGEPLSQFDPPWPAWEGLQWMQLQRELRELTSNQNGVFSTIASYFGRPTRNDPLRNSSLMRDLQQEETSGVARQNGFSRLVESLKDMPEEVKTDIGIEALGRFTQAARATVVGGTIAGLGTTAINIEDPETVDYLPALIKGFYENSYHVNMNRCVRKPDPEDFAMCASDWLGRKFQVSFAKQLFLKKKAVYEIKPGEDEATFVPKIQAELDRISAKREEFVKLHRFKADFKEEITETFRSLDPNNELHLQTIGAIKDEKEFREAAMKQMEILFSQHFDAYRDRIKAILETEDPGAQQDLLRQLTAVRPEMANTLSSMINYHTCDTSTLQGMWGCFGQSSF